MTVKLRVNGREFAGWKSARVTRSIEAVSGSFDLEVSDRWSAGVDPWPIEKEDVCSLLIGDDTLITGFVDKRSASYDANEHSISVSGKDKTAALVECSAYLSQWEFKNIHLQSFASKVCEPFGITVVLHAALGQAAIPRVAKLSVDPGDTAFEAIEKACRISGVLAISDGAGRLMLARPGTARASTELVEGQNILAASSTSDASQVYSQYIALGQRKGTDEDNGASVARAKGRAEDPGVLRTDRILLLRPEGSVTTEQANKRAQWEATVRAAQAETVSVTVQGWTQANGALWPINARVNVRSPFLGVEGEMLITQATYSLDDRTGTTTHLELKRPDAFTPEPVISKVKTNNYWKELL